MATLDSLNNGQQATLLNSPAMNPPDGIEPNFENPFNRNRPSLALMIVGMTLTSFCIAIRAYTRIFCLKKVRLEDCVYYEHSVDRCKRGVLTVNT